MSAPLDLELPPGVLLAGGLTSSKLASMACSAALLGPVLYQNNGQSTYNNDLDNGDICNVSIQVLTQ